MMIQGFTSFSTYSLDQSFEVSTEITKSELAHARYDPSMDRIGWDVLYIYTSKEVEALQQHRAAGFL